MSGLVHGIAVGSHALVWVTGSDAVSFLDGQVSQDVAAMAAGEVRRSFLLEPRGTRRLPSLTMVDVRVSKAVALGGLGRVELLMDLLNTFNQATEEGLATDNLYSQNFGRPTVYVDPRRVMLGARFALGR